MKRKDFWKGFGMALALIVVLNLAWKPICRAIPWHVLPFEISMSKNAKVGIDCGSSKKVTGSPLHLRVC